MQSYLTLCRICCCGHSVSDLNNCAQIGRTNAVKYDPGPFGTCTQVGPDVAPRGGGPAATPPYTLEKVADGLRLTYERPDGSGNQFALTVYLPCNTQAGAGAPGRMVIDERRSQYSVRWPTDATCESAQHVCTTTCLPGAQDPEHCCECGLELSQYAGRPQVAVGAGRASNTDFMISLCYPIP